MKELIKKFVPRQLIGFYHFFLALMAVLVFRFPARHLKIIGVTGTKGKSTVVEFCHQILEEAGLKTASLSSIRFKIGKEERPNLTHTTMPGPFLIQEFLQKALKAGCQYIILEVTSEGIIQYRHKFLNFQTAIFTNLAPEHIERHGGFENYRAAKGELFKAAKNTHILNLDDGNIDYFLQFEAREKRGYGLENPNSKTQISNKIQNPNFKTIVAKNTRASDEGGSFFVENIEFNLKLLGEFNIYNALAAICFALSEGVSLEICQKALGKITVIPGRMETVINEPFRVIVDQAHTPESLEKAYQAILQAASFRPSATGKLICVFGSAGGGRDKWKRPKMGEIASKYCEEIILTNEDCYSENLFEILAGIKSGISETHFPLDRVYEIPDRREAIKKALRLARNGDKIIITGKGCEPWLFLANNKKIPWDERQVVREEFYRMQKTSDP